MDEDPAPTPPTPEQLAEREEMAGHLRTLIRFACEQRLGAVPAEVEALLPDEHSLGVLMRWYIGAGTLSAEDLTALLHAPCPE